MNYLLIISVLLMPSCGQTDSSSAPAPTAVSTETTKSQTPASATDSKVTSQKALYINDTASMPVCSADNKDQLIYVVSIKQFYACDSSWVAVDLKGEKGATGSNGAQGIAGAKGDKGDAGQTVNGNNWYDVIDQKYWLIPSLEKTSSAANAVAQCGGATSAWRTPTETELSNAVSRGLKTAADAISAPRDAWIKGSGSDDYYVSRAVRDSANVMDSLAGYYCIQK